MPDDSGRDVDGEEASRSRPDDAVQRAVRLRHVQSGQSQLFIVRVWSAHDGATPEWQGRVQHILRGESYPFTGWDQLLSLIELMLPPPDPEGPQDKGVAE